LTSETCHDRNARRELWFDDILQSRADRIDFAFNAAGACCPKSQWTPRADEAQTLPIRHLIRYFEEKSLGTETVQAAILDPADLRPALGYVNLLEPVDDGRDFRFRIFGTFVAAVTGQDMTGMLLSELPASDYVIDHAMATYRAAYARRLPLLSTRIPLGAATTSRWERLVLPFTDASNAVTRLLVGAVPIGLAGIPMRPSVLSGA
jgi:hypothetical protein